MKKPLKMKTFKNEDAERRFWAKADLAKLTNVKDWERVVFPELKPTSRSISIRVPEYLLIIIKEQANELDIPYQTLIKQYLAKGALNKKKQKV